MATIENFDMGGGGFEITLENPSLEDLENSNEEHKEEKKKRKKVSLSPSKIMSIMFGTVLSPFPRQVGDKCTRRSRWMFVPCWGHITSSGHSGIIS